jgi:hypothetical protein
MMMPFNFLKDLWLSTIADQTIWATIKGEVVFFRVVMFKYTKLN